MPESSPLHPRITKTPGVCGGKACIAGSRIRVLDVVSLYEHQGLSMDEVAAHFPHVSLAELHAAMAYYFDHAAEIHHEMWRAQEIAEEFARTNESLLQRKLDAIARGRAS